MIQINLLPDTDRKGRAKAKAPEKIKGPGGGGAEGTVVVLFALIVASVVGATGLYSWNSVHQVKSEYQHLEAQKKAVDQEIGQLSDKAREIQKLRQIFTSQWEVLQSLDPPNRILWCEKVNMLANLVPADVFLTDLSVDEQSVDVEVQSSIDARTKWEGGGKKGPKPEVVKKPVINYTFRITGLATGADNVQQFDNVIKFHDALIAHESVDAWGQKRRFMDSLNPNIEFEKVEATLYEGHPVNQFIFKLRTQPIGGETKKPAAEKTDVVSAPAPASSKTTASADKKAPATTGRRTAAESGKKPSA